MTAITISVPDPKTAWDTFSRQALSLKTVCQSVQAGGQTVFVLSNLIQAANAFVTSTNGILNDATRLAAFNNFMQQIKDNVNYDCTADFQTTVNAAQALLTAAINEYPKNGQSVVQERVLNANGTFSANALSNSSIPTTMTAIGAWLATIA